MNNVVIMGSSAGAIMTSQLGSIITNSEYANLLGIKSVLKKEQAKALIIDDAPLVYDKFPLATKILVGNYIKGSVYVSKDEIKKYNNYDLLKNAIKKDLSFLHSVVYYYISMFFNSIFIK